MSNCQKGYIEALLDTTPLKPYITGHLCYGDTNCQKDVTIRRLMKQYNLKKVFYVGDTQEMPTPARKRTCLLSWPIMVSETHLPRLTGSPSPKSS
ncbi:MAG: hypothetical protein ACLR2E_19485 [Lachnospiraceae bacterium]